MPHYRGDPDYLAPGEDSAAMVELKEMQRSLPWQKYFIYYFIFLYFLFNYIKKTFYYSPSDHEK